MLHTLKGLAATMGATQLASEAALCEKQLSAQAAPDALVQAVKQACQAIAEHGAGLQALLDALHAVQAQAASASSAEPG